MGWFGSLLGTGGVVDGIKDGIDKSILTPEERLDYHKELLKSYEPFKVIQRGLAFMVAGLFSFVVIVSTILFILGLYFNGLVSAVKDFNNLESIQMVGYSFMTVMSLYFSGGVINTFFKDKK